MASISLKFGGQVFHGVQTDSSKFGVICLKIKVRRELFLFLIGENTVKLLLFITYVKKSIFCFADIFCYVIILNDVTMQFPL